MGCAGVGRRASAAAGRDLGGLALQVVAACRCRAGAALLARAGPDLAVVALLRWRRAGRWASAAAGRVPGTLALLADLFKSVIQQLRDFMENLGTTQQKKKALWAAFPPSTNSVPSNMQL